MESRKKAIDLLGGGTAAFFGTVGLIALTIGSGLGSIFKLSGHKSKSLNLLGAVGQGIQHIPYYPRFTLPEKEEALRLKGANAPQGRINEHNSLYKLGTIANVTNILLPVLELVKSENRWINFGKSVFKQLAEKSSMMFFAKRRKVMGTEWMEKT